MAVSSAMSWLSQPSSNGAARENFGVAAAPSRRGPDLATAVSASFSRPALLLRYGTRSASPNVVSSRISI